MKNQMRQQYRQLNPTNLSYEGPMLKNSSIFSTLGKNLASQWFSHLIHYTITSVLLARYSSWSVGDHENFLPWRFKFESGSSAIASRTIFRLEEVQAKLHFSVSLPLAQQRLDFRSEKFTFLVTKTFQKLLVLATIFLDCIQEILIFLNCYLISLHLLPKPLKPSLTW